MVQGNDWSSVGKLIFKSSIRFLGSGQRLIECWKAHFQEFDSFSWFRATTDRVLESSFSRVRFVFLVQGNDWSSVGKLIFKSSIRFLGSGQRLIECWKARFQEFDSFSWFRATTDRALESSFSRVRFVFFSRCPEPRKRIELLKTSFPTLDQSLPWTKKTNRTLENELSNARSVVALNQENESNSWKRAFQSSITRCLEIVALNQENESNSWKRAFQRAISRCPEPRKRIELLKMSFPTFDQSLPWTKKTNRTLENELSNTRSVVALNQENESNSWKWAFQHLISRNARWFRATTDRVLESSFSRVRFVFLVQGNDWSNVGKLIFKSSIRFLGSGQRLIECWKARFQEFDSFSWFRARTDRMLESSFSRVRFVFLVQGNDWSNVGKLIFKSSIRLLQSLPWTKKTNRTLENELSNIRSVLALNQENESNSWKRAFQHSISRCPEPSKRIELLKMSFPTFDQSLPWTKKTNRTLENELSNIRAVLALNQENESNSWKRAFQHSMVQGNDWSNVGKLIFKSSIRFLGSGQRLIERWKAHFQEFDSFSWFRATTDRMLESSFSRVRFVFLVQGKEWSSVGKLIFKSSIRLLGSGQRLIERWKAHFQEFDSFSWFRATTDRALESSFSRVRFVFLVQGNDWSNVGKLIFKSSIHLLGSGQRLIECWKAHFQEFDSFSSVVALNQVNESNSWKWAFQHSISRCPEPRKRIELLKMSFPTFDQSLPWTKKTNRTLENELSNIRWFRATTDRALESSFSRVQFVFLVQGNDWSSVGKLIFKSSIRFLGSGQGLIERWKAHFQEFDSFSWFRATTDRMLESSFSRVRFVFLVQGNDWSNVGKLVFKSSIRFLGSGQWLIECWKARFQEFNSFYWFRATTDRMLESSFSRVRFVFLVQGNDWSSVGKLIFKSSIRFLQSLPWTKKTNRTLENELSNIRSVVALNQENESNSWKWAFQHSISRCPEPRKRIELLKMSFPTFDQS